MRGAGKAASTCAGRDERKTDIGRKTRVNAEARPDLDGIDSFEDMGLLRLIQSLSV